MNNKQITPSFHFKTTKRLFSPLLCRPTKNKSLPVSPHVSYNSTISFQHKLIDADTQTTPYLYGGYTSCIKHNSHQSNHNNRLYMNFIKETSNSIKPKPIGLISKHPVVHDNKRISLNQTSIIKYKPKQMHFSNAAIYSRITSNNHKPNYKRKIIIQLPTIITYPIQFKPRIHELKFNIK